MIVKVQQSLNGGGAMALIYNQKRSVMAQQSVASIPTLAEAFEAWGPKFYCRAYWTPANELALDLSKQVKGDF